MAKTEERVVWVSKDGMVRLVRVHGEPIRYRAEMIAAVEPKATVWQDLPASSVVQRIVDALGERCA